MPNRIIKESICTSENVDALSAFQETVFYRLIVNCDDYGRMDARPKVLASRLFPLKNIRADQIEAALRALTSAELVILYNVDGKPFLQMKTWERHQTIRAKKSRYPAPMQADASKCIQVQADASKCSRNSIQSNPIQSESEGESARAREEAADKPPRSPKFKPPTVEEVAEYCKERGNSVDAQRFVDFYASKGWRVGAQPMKDWKAAVRTWERRDDVKQRSEKPTAEPERPKPAAAELERLRRVKESML